MKTPQNELECENGHKMTGIGFEDCCPECEAPWKTHTNSEWETELREYIDKTLKPKKPTMSGLDREIIIDFVRKLLLSQKEEMVEKIENMAKALLVSTITRGGRVRPLPRKMPRL